MNMSRLADYFVVVGYDHGKERKCISTKYLIYISIQYNHF